MSSVIDAVLAQYEKNKQSTNNSNKVSQEERLKKYFTTVLKPKEKTGEKRVRILPTSDGSSPFVEVYFHEIMVDGKPLKLYDPGKNDGLRSPLNEVSDSLLQTGDAGDKELSKTYRSKKFYIVKVIDRDNEQDGPKFWRFKHAFKNDGIFDKISPLFRNKGDITDVITGRDLTLSLAIAKSNNGKEYTTITSVIPEDIGPLHSDPEKVKEWVEDELTWSDVYSKKSEEYLELVALGEVPKWDENLKKFVSGTTGEAPVGGDNTPDIIDPQASETEDDDLPF